MKPIAAACLVISLIAAFMFGEASGYRHGYNIGWIDCARAIAIELRKNEANR